MARCARSERVLAAVLLLVIITTACGHSWERSGCHLVGHTRKIRIPGCVVFSITTNACRGFCSSYSTPAPDWLRRSNRVQSVWSVGQCCVIMETEDVKAEVMCLDGMRSLLFKSAEKCSCYVCKKE